mmetsp:Transcript_35478/g.72565  ORF Transcript_35478/g.72565 Transcript_35478/m.72565 type:complete len:422 (+) Transcript_35478:168-1433(+)
MNYWVQLLGAALIATFVVAFPVSSFSASRIIHHTTSPARIKSKLHQQRPQKDQVVIEEECLVPEENPNYNPDAKSSGGVRYGLVQKGIDELYPPKELSSRNAKSRTDGYWKYVERGEKPPLEFTYGEFDLLFFGELLDRAWEHYQSTSATDNVDVTDTKPWENKTFIDIGSGTGRLVISAAAMHPHWRACKGLEILKGIHSESVSIADGCTVSLDEKNELDIQNESVKSILRIPQADTPSDNDERYIPLAPMHMIQGSFTNPYQYLADTDCAFVFSSCMNPGLLEQLSIAIGRQCRPGTIIITTEFPLFLTGHIDPLEDDESMPSGDYEIELLEKIDGWCWLMGGESTAYIHRVKSSLSNLYGGPKERPRLSLEEEAYQLVQLMEGEGLTDTKVFMRNVLNNMIFNDVPPEFLPELDDDEA